MTNREWLSTLTDEQLASWLTDEAEYDEVLSPRLVTIRRWSTSSYHGVLAWLGEEKP